MHEPTANSRPQQPNDRLGRLARLTLKELREILRDRRTIITLFLMPLLLYPVLSIAFQQFFLSSLGPGETPRYLIGFRTAVEEDYVKEYLELGRFELASLHAVPDAKGETQEPEIGVPGNNYGDLEAVVRENQLDVGIRFADGQQQRLDRRADVAVDLELIYNPHVYSSREAVEYVEKCLAAANEGFLAARLQVLGVSQRAIPIRTARKIVEDPQSKGSTVSLTSVVPFILILMTITGAVYPAIDLTAGERERGTLEVLVAAPIPRVGLLFAKYVAVVTVALLTATANLATMTLMIEVSGLGRLVFGDAGVSAGMISAVFGLLLLFAAFFSAVLLVLTSFARSFKEAQAYLIPLMLVSLAPGMISLKPGLELTGLWLVTPLANIVLLGRDLFEARASGWAAIIVVASTMLYAAGAIALAARIFGAESVLYSSQAGWRDLWRRSREPQPFPNVGGALTCLALLFPAYFLANNLQARLVGENLNVMLVFGAVATMLLFGGFPLIAVYLGRIPLGAAFRLHAPPWWAWPAAIALGLSLWMAAHEAVLLQQYVIGVITKGTWAPAPIDERLLERGRAIVEQLRALSPLVVVLCLGVIPAVFEELFFRGYLLSALRGATSAPMALIGSALLFGLFHLVARDGLAIERFLPSAFLGFVLGGVCLRTGSVLPGILLHATHNSLILLALHFQPQLESRGWGVSEQHHLPMMWLAAGGLLAVGGIVAVWFGGARSFASRG